MWWNVGRRGCRGQSTMEYLLIFAAVVGIVAWAAANLVTGKANTTDAAGNVIVGKDQGIRKLFWHAGEALKTDGGKLETGLTN